MKGAPIVILDEATAYADPENEALVERAISKLVAGKTLVTIAHRLSTVRGADQILVMDAGRIVGRGTHEELLEGCEVYARMWSRYADALSSEAPASSAAREAGGAHGARATQEGRAAQGERHAAQEGETRVAQGDETRVDSSSSAGERKVR